MRFGVVAPMPSELRPVVKAFGLRRGRLGDLDGHVGTVGAAEVLALTSGIGTARGEATARRLVEAGRVDHLLVVGIAGGVGPTVALRQLVVPAVVSDWPGRHPRVPARLGAVAPAGELVSSDEYGHPPEVLADLAATGVVAVDMETTGVAVAGEALGVPWTAFRAISDRADDDTFEVGTLGLVDADGNPRPGAALRHLARHPGRLPTLARLARDATAAAVTAARAAAQAVETG